MENLPQEFQDKTQPPSLIPQSVKGIDRKIFEAKNSKLLIECDQYEFNQLVLKICALIGCSLPSPESAAQLFAWCCDNYMGITSKGFELSFGLNAAGSMPSKINHFGSFDASFIGDVLAQYSEMQRKANQQAQKTVHEDHAVALLDSPMNNDAREQMLLDHIEAVKNEKYILPELMGATMFDWLLKSGKLDTDTIPMELNIAWKKKARGIIFEEMRINTAKWNRIEQTRGLEYQRITNAIFCEFKRLAYIWFIKSQIK